MGFLGDDPDRHRIVTDSPDTCLSIHRWSLRIVDCRLLGKIAQGKGLVLEPPVILQAVSLDTRRAIIVCLACGQWREFRGSWLRGAS
jgi:hypothetical protein